MKVLGALMSMEAKGKIGERLVFSKRASGQQARFQKAQKDVLTDARILQRSIYKDAVTAWNFLTLVEKASYIDIAKQYHYTGYNLFISEYILSSLYGVCFYGVDSFG